MPRNLDRRVEAVVPIEQPGLVEQIGDLLELYIQDTSAGWLLEADGRYKPPGQESQGNSAQEQLMQSKK